MGTHGKEGKEIGRQGEGKGERKKGTPHIFTWIDAYGHCYARRATRYRLCHAFLIDFVFL